MEFYVFSALYYLIFSRTGVLLILVEQREELDFTDDSVTGETTFDNKIYQIRGRRL